MRLSKPQILQKQRGAVLFIVLMVLVALTLITLLATNMGKTDIKISYAYKEQTQSFTQGESMLARLLYALEQIPTPSYIDNELIFHTNKLVAGGSGEPDFTNPNFASGWSDKVALDCGKIKKQIESKLSKEGNENSALKPLDCKSIQQYSDEDKHKDKNKNKTKTVIEFVRRKPNKGDIDSLRDTYYYRITINAQGDTTGHSLIQGVTGIQYY